VVNLFRFSRVESPPDVGPELVLQEAAATAQRVVQRRLDAPEAHDSRDQEGGEVQAAENAAGRPAAPDRRVRQQAQKKKPIMWPSARTNPCFQ